MSEDRSWMLLNRTSEEWQKGLENFLKTTFRGNSRGVTAPCPCTRCRCLLYRKQSEVQKHLLSRGFDSEFIKGEGEGDGKELDEDNACDEGTGDGGSINDLVSSLIRGAIHGEIIGTSNEEPNESAKTFFNLLKEAEKDLYPECKEATKVSFIMRLFQIKCMFGISNRGLEAILHLFALVLPEGHCVPNRQGSKGCS